jgi:GNAT superfamily N-acetyltransferase
MTHHPDTHRAETGAPVIAVMTSRDAHQIFEVMRDAASGSRRHLPPGVSGVDDLIALMHDGVAFFVAYLDGEPVGALGYRWERRALKIVHVAVKEQHQRLGVGRRLVQAVESVGFALGTTTVVTEAAPEGMALPFERFGYQPATAGRADRREMHKALRERIR